MKTKNINIFSFVIILILLSSCEKLLDVEPQGATKVEDFYKTDDQAVESVAGVYLQCRELAANYFFVKNLLSDDVYCGGGSRGDNPQLEQINEYRFSPANANISGLYSALYTLIYRSNLIINNFEADTDVKTQVIAEAKIARAWAYFELVTLWGPVPLVIVPLESDEFQQPNGKISEIWSQIEKDLNDAINTSLIPENTEFWGTITSSGARFTKQAALSFLGKAQLFQGKYAEAATTLQLVINSGKYALLIDDDISTPGQNDYGNILRAVNDFSSENIFEVNSLNDPENQWSQGLVYSIPNMCGWRGDHLTSAIYWSYGGAHDYAPSGWGFFNPRKDVYDAFVDMEGVNGYRLNQTMITYPQFQMLFFGFGVVSYLYGHEGYFSWKNRLLMSEGIEGTYGYSFHTNFRYLRYAEVLLLASEACLMANDGREADALTYINIIRSRAQLSPLATVALDDIKAEKRLELWCEGTRYQDLIRWGDAATALANQGHTLPNLMSDGTVVNAFTNSAYGFKPGQHELLPFPEHEISVNHKIVQNPGW